MMISEDLGHHEKDDGGEGGKRCDKELRGVVRAVAEAEKGPVLPSDTPSAAPKERNSRRGGVRTRAGRQ